MESPKVDDGIHKKTCHHPKSTLESYLNIDSGHSKIDIP